MHSVLLVDDEEIVRKGLRRLVDWDELGVERLAEAWNGEAALREMERLPFDVVVTDVVMPVMNGLALVRAIRERWPQTVVIVVSGHDDFPYVREAMGTASWTTSSSQSTRASSRRRCTPPFRSWRRPSTAAW